MVKIVNLFLSSKPKNSGQLRSNEDTTKTAIDERLRRTLGMTEHLQLRSSLLELLNTVQ